MLPPPPRIGTGRTWSLQLPEPSPDHKEEAVKMESVEKLEVGSDT